MTKSRFMEKQPSVKVIEKDKIYIYICLNEKEIIQDCADREESAKPITIYEYDYNEIIEAIGIIDINDVKTNPEKYLDYGDFDFLNTLKLSKINETKMLLEEYLKEHPLFSKIKYKDGRYYNVTSEKQSRLTSKILLYNLYAKNGENYQLTWNDTGNICENWSIDELTNLSMEIDAYVTPLISKQQKYEIQIRTAETEDFINKMIIQY